MHTYIYEYRTFRDIEKHKDFKGYFDPKVLGISKNNPIF